MAKTALKNKQQKTQKFTTREYTRCTMCGRPHAVLKKYGICRVCLENLLIKVKFLVLKRQVGKEENKDEC